MSLDGESSLSGQEVVWQLMFGFADSMALKCATELGIADIINSHGAPITITQIASDMKYTPSPDMPYLARIMRFLARKNVFTVHNPPDGAGEPLYGLNHISIWLLSDSELSLKAMVTMENHHWLQAPWHCLGQCIREGGIAFEKAHGADIWKFASAKPEFSSLFNEGMACTARIATAALLEGYNGGFRNVGSVVDVGGGTGSLIAKIVKAHPHIKGINFDLPHVVAAAPAYDGVCHVGGNMFEAVPSADAIFMKWVLHDWGDEVCIKILQNCRKAMRDGKNGKLVLVEIVLQPDETNRFGDMGFVFDLAMIAHATGGKERTELEWKNLLRAGGFSRFNFIKIAALPFAIEAFPERHSSLLQVLAPKTQIMYCTFF